MLQRDRGKKVNGGCSQKEKRRCRRSLSCPMQSVAPKWTLMAKAFRRSRWKSFRDSEDGQKELTGEEVEVRLAKWISMEHRKGVLKRYRGTCDILFGIEHRVRKEEMEEQFNKEAKEGWRFAASAARITDAGSKLRKREAMTIASTRQEEFWWQSTATSERLCEQKKGRLSRFQERKKNRPSMGEWSEEGCASSPRISAIRKDGRREMKPSWKRC